MLRRSITYTNPFTDQTVTEDHYFHLSKADLIEMEMAEHTATYKANDGQDYTGMQARLLRIAESNDGKAIIEEIKDFIRRSYGRKEGDRFIKNDEVWQDFKSTEAFSQLLYDLCTDASVAAEFINGIVPNNLEEIAEDIRKRAAAQEKAELATVTPIAPGGDPTGLTNGVTPQVLTQQQVTEMDANELQAGLADGRYKLS